MLDEYHNKGLYDEQKLSWGKVPREFPMLTPSTEEKSPENQTEQER